MMEMAETLIAHCEWKDRLYQAIAKREQLDRDMIASDKLCAFGKWLYAEGAAEFHALPVYQECVSTHAEFHAQAGFVAEALNAGEYEKALKMLEAKTPYAKASQQLSLKVIDLHKAIEKARR